jgi:hypothetical protein
MVCYTSETGGMKKVPSRFKLRDASSSVFGAGDGFISTFCPLYKKRPVVLLLLLAIASFTFAPAAR